MDDGVDGRALKLNRCFKPFGQTLSLRSVGGRKGRLALRAWFVNEQALHQPQINRGHP
jgi:hypothetical protein